jgi:hypothetical protein
MPEEGKAVPYLYLRQRGWYLLYFQEDNAGATNNNPGT